MGKSKKSEPVGGALAKSTKGMADQPNAQEKLDPMNDYETKGHLQTLMDAHHIMNDASKMKKVQKLVGSHKKAIRGIQDIRDYHNETYGTKSSLPGLKGQDADGDMGE